MYIIKAIFIKLTQYTTVKLAYVLQLPDLDISRKMYDFANAHIASLCHYAHCGPLFVFVVSCNSKVNSQ